MKYCKSCRYFNFTTSKNGCITPRRRFINHFSNCILKQIPRIFQSSLYPLVQYIKVLHAALAKLNNVSGSSGYFSGVAVSLVSTSLTGWTEMETKIKWGVARVDTVYIPPGSVSGTRHFYLFSHTVKQFTSAT
jgi:hypothetical protein